ncbi:hypothetical protein MtrunA17_Chr8g0347871 [Medicago truncatula]|uniref:Intracellular protein transporter USO1-like protein, putative n=1 Tax=Medicago truncatula TaxID=3880 RepID=G7ZYR7_MEDTR|nr:uncharacterized protein At5g41620 isoform X1 [Medicago truncatula]KEH18746.1 intracellular protein transporter USO1-like protein, putative [Medicago truncatula]RHN39802.1 hypothetical protein MtrunA17_Chr8g0347871 [Medicago truncatula]
MSFVCERGDKKRIVMVEKWKKGVLVGKRGGICSTPSTTWRFDPPSQQNSIVSTSARKLCANLWQIQHTPFAKMNKHGGTILRRRRRLHHQSTTSDQSPSASTIRRHVIASLVQRYRSVGKNACALPPASPGYNNSVEVAPYKCEVTSTSSIDIKGITEESRYNLATSKEVLNVLNRIWSLEEQHASNISAVKALKTELNRSRTQMKELIREKQMNRQEMEKLMKQMTIEKFVRKNKEHDRIQTEVQSLKEELEDERRLRKHSESLQQRLACELSEVKSSFSSCLRNLEQERKAQILLENLCDEFAKGIKNYEQKVHCLRQNSENGYLEGENVDRLILHISEGWLDERTQMKRAQSDSDIIDRISIVDKLGFDIETFLHAKRSIDFKKYGYSSPKELKEIYPCQHLMDSFLLQDMTQEDSIDNDCFEPKETTAEGLRKLGSKTERNNATELHQEKGSKNSIRKEVLSKAITEDFHLQANIKRNMSCNDNNESCFVEKKLSEMGEDSIKRWKSMLIASDFDNTESSTKLPKGVKENTLMAKLLEARLERQISRSKRGKSTS